MLRTEKQITNFLLLALLLLNALIRFYDISGFSLSNDELSALSRLNYPSLSELIQYGVIATDPHPMGIQVFLYYWTALFGNDVLAVRFPFVLASLFAIFFLFKTMSLWFSKQRALLIAVFYSLTEFSLIHGQLARPYAMAMLFVMVFLWSWTHILFAGTKKRIHLLAFIVSAVFAVYSHYFAALLVGIIGISGIPFALRKNLFKLYSLLGLCIVFLSTTHLPISIKQFGRTSMTSWIHEAEPSFLFEHLFLLLNNSWILVALSSILFLVSLYNWRRAKENEKKFMLLSVAFFLLPMIIAYFYSINKESVLMNRVFYFSSPFFYAAFLALIPDLKSRTFIVRFSVLTIGVLTSTFLQTNFLKRDYVENFKDLAQKDYMTVHAIAKNEQKNIGFIGNFNSLEYLNYYLNRENLNWPISSVSTNKELAQMMEYVKDNTAQLMAYFWACKYQSLSVLEYLALHYPTIKKESDYYNSGMWLLSSEGNSRKANLNLNLLDTILYPETEFLNLFKDDKSELLNKEVINVHFTFESNEVNNTLLVLSLVNKGGEVLKWEGVSLSDFDLNKSENEVFYSFIIPDEYNEKDELAIYVWNPGKNKCVLRNLNLRSYEKAFTKVDPYANIRRP